MATIDARTGRDGKTYYRVRVRVKGSKVHSATFERKRDAQEWAERTQAQLRKGRHLDQDTPARRTLVDLIDRYLELELPKRDRNQADIRKHLIWWRESYGHLVLSNVTPSVLAEGRDRLLQEPVSEHKYAPRDQAVRTKKPATVVRYMADLSNALSVAAGEWEWIDANPMHKVKKPRLPQERVRFLNHEERECLLRACRDSPCPYLYPVVVIALSTGARYSEVMHLRWKDVDLERGIARLEHTKNRDRRALPLTHHALEVVRELRDQHKRTDTDLLFPRADGQAPIELRKHWNRALQEAGIEDFRFHDLRHTAASYLAMNGATLAEIADVLGHRTLQMVKRYAHLSDQHTASVVERMNRRMFGDSSA